MSQAMMNKPKYLRIKDLLLSKIRSGDYQPGQKLISREKLAKEFNCTQATCTRSIEELVLEGVLEARHGVGTFVAQHPAGVVSTKVSVIIPNARVPFYCQFLDTALNMVMETSFIPGNVGIVGEEVSRESNLIRRFLQQRESVIFLRAFKSEESRRMILAEPERFYIFGRAPELVGKTNVLDTDSEAGVCLAITHLAELGHRRIAYLGSDCARDGSRKRAYQSGLIVNGIALSPELEFDCPPFELADQNQRNEAMLQTIVGMRSLADPPTALFAYSDSIAFHLISIAEREGMQVPSDLSVCGYNASYSEGFGYHRMTSIRSPLKEQFQKALSHLENAKTGFLNECLLPHLVRGNTTAPRLTGSSQEPERE
jgi:DNA-binding LacI/PurR family transcriptional regulator